MDINNWVDSVNESQETYGDFDSYEIEPKPLGTGGFAKVYKVKKNGKTYAMKVPNIVTLETNETVCIDSSANSEFKTEARNWAKASVAVPDAVVNLIDYNVIPFPWMVMELAEGSFRDAMTDQKADMKDIVSILRSLQKVHEAGIVHRDIKPENILKVRGKWKFTDFGLSKVMNSVSSSADEIKGTPQYMAPEQVSKKQFGNVDETTDIWQMGILLYEALMGKFPYATTNFAELGMAIICDGPDVSDAPAEYIQILKKALSRNKQSRYQTAKMFADELEAVVDPNAKVAVPVTSTSQTTVVFGADPVSLYNDARKTLASFPSADEAAEAVRCLTRASELGHTDAQCLLAFLYEKGESVPKDNDKAVQWYIKSANGGNVTAQYNLGVIYAQGKVAGKDYRRAQKYLTDALNNGYPQAKKALNLVEKAMKKDKGGK